MTDTSAADRVIWESNRVEAVERGKRRIVRRPGWHRLRAWPIRDAIKRMDWMDHRMDGGRDTLREGGSSTAWSRSAAANVASDYMRNPKMFRRRQAPRRLPSTVHWPTPFQWRVTVGMDAFSESQRRCRSLRRVATLCEGRQGRTDRSACAAAGGQEVARRAGAICLSIICGRGRGSGSEPPSTPRRSRRG